MSHAMWFEHGEIEYFSNGPQKLPAIQQEPDFVPANPLAQVVFSELVLDSAMYYYSTRDRTARIIVRSMHLGIPVVQATIIDADGNQTVRRGSLLGCRKDNVSEEIIPGIIRQKHLPIIESEDGLSLLPKIVRGPKLRNTMLRRFK